MLHLCTHSTVGSVSLINSRIPFASKKMDQSQAAETENYSRPLQFHDGCFCLHRINVYSLPSAAISMKVRHQMEAAQATVPYTRELWIPKFLLNWNRSVTCREWRTRICPSTVGSWNIPPMWWYPPLSGCPRQFYEASGCSTSRLVRKRTTQDGAANWKLLPV